MTKRITIRSKKANKKIKAARKAAAPKKTTITVEYSSSNSGGRWWLTDKNWKDLEKAGWKVQWFKKQPKGSMITKLAKDGRWLGALAREATFECKTPDEAIKSWTSVTDLDPWAQGCNCCGRPHSFSYKDAKGNHHWARTRVVSDFSGWD